MAAISGFFPLLPDATHCHFLKNALRPLSSDAEMPAIDEPAIDDGSVGKTLDDSLSDSESLSLLENYLTLSISNPHCFCYC